VYFLIFLPAVFSKFEFAHVAGPTITKCSGGAFQGGFSPPLIGGAILDINSRFF